MRLLLLVLLISSTLTAQIKKSADQEVLIGEHKKHGYAIVKCTKSQSRYTFWYENYRDPAQNETKSFSFENVDGDFESLYAMIMDGFETIPEAPVILQLPNDVVWLNFIKSYGTVKFRFSHDDGRSTEGMAVTDWMTKKNVKKLFGKR